MKELIIDSRMRTIEKNKLKELGYNLIELPKSENVYEEISSHTDIFCTKLNNALIVEKSRYAYLKEKISSQINIYEGKEYAQNKYPFDIKYNACIIGKKAIHNFKYTDELLKKMLIENGYELIDVKQGYSNCSIAVIDEKNIIISDEGLYNILKKLDLNILKIDSALDIKLLYENSYSEKIGFIGGCISRIDDFVFVSGDLKKIDPENKIRNFINNLNLEIIEFEHLDMIDYGGIIKI